MKVRLIKEWLNQFSEDDEVAITSMDDDFYCNNFELHSPYYDGQAQEIILPLFLENN